MRFKRSPDTRLVGLTVGLLAMLLLSFLMPAGDVAIAQDDPTEPTPTAETPPPTLTFEIQAAYILAQGGDLNNDGVVNPGDTVNYTVTVRNTGDAISGPVEVVMQFDPAFISGVAAISDSGIGEQGKVVWSLPGLDVDQRKDLSFAATLLGI